MIGIWVLRSELEEKVSIWYTLIEGGPLRRAIYDGVVNESELKYFGSYLILINMVVESALKKKLDTEYLLDPYAIDHKVSNILGRINHVPVDRIRSEVVRLGELLMPYGAAQFERDDMLRQN